MGVDAWAKLLADLRADHSSGATALTRRAAGGLSLLGDAAVESDDPAAALRGGLRDLATIRPPFASLLRLADAAAYAVADESAPARWPGALHGVAARFL